MTGYQWPPYRLEGELAERVESVRAVLAETEADAEQRRMLPEEAFGTLADAGLFRLALPTELGGLEVPPLVEMEVYEAVSRVSTAACWNLSAGCLYSSWAAAYLSDDAVREIFGSGGPAVVAGQGPPRGTAVAAEGGVRVTGRYGFGSGMSHATWVLGGFTAPPPDDEWRAFVVPKERVDVLDNWHAVGLAGSGSVDYAVRDLFVPDGYWFPLGRPRPLRGGPRFAAPIAAQVAAAHCGVALGAGERALDAVVSAARSAGSPLAARGAFHRDLGEAHTRLSAARDHAARLLGALGDRLRHGPRPDRLFVQQLVAAETYVTEVATDVTTMAYRYAGTAAIRLDHPLQRILRDLLVALQHKFIADTSYDVLGTSLLDDVRRTA